MEAKTAIRNAATYALAQVSFWDYCKITAPDFYKDDRPHLQTLCDTLQNIYEKKLLKPDGTPYKKLMINMPPQHGKTRTLVKFTEWALGQNPQERILNGSYNDIAASDFGRYVRDGIDEIKNQQEQIVYSDIFPGTRLKYGNKSYMRWALEGQHFNFISTGVGGSVTGKGGTIKIIDDLIKSAEDAGNELKLEKDWNWYVGTWGSRNAAEGGEALEIICFTRWSKYDVCGRLLATEQKDDWYQLKMEVYDKETDKMLCEEIYSRKKYEDSKYLAMKNPITQMVFMANYHQETIDVQGRLYRTFKTYTKAPAENGKSLFDGVHSYTDTADEGTDFLCTVVYGIYENEAYVLDVDYTKDGMEITEPQTAKTFVENSVNVAYIESNNGGRGFARAVQRILKQKYKTNKTVIRWFHQSNNKKHRIHTNSAWVQEHIYFPVNWMDKWPEFYEAMTSYQKEGKNKNDDAPDAVTGICEKINIKGVSFLK